LAPLADNFGFIEVPLLDRALKIPVCDFVMEQTCPDLVDSHSVQDDPEFCHVFDSAPNAIDQ
jgi:hypothetical protein